MDDEAILHRWTEYCKELYNYDIKTDDDVIRTRPQNEDIDAPILRSEVEEAVRSLKKGKSPGTDNVPGELIITGGEEVDPTVIRGKYDKYRYGAEVSRKGAGIFTAKRNEF